jgi:hypothetical protein
MITAALACLVGLACGSRLDGEGTGSPCYQLDDAGMDDLSKPTVSKEGNRDHNRGRERER